MKNILALDNEDKDIVLRKNLIEVSQRYHNIEKTIDSIIGNNKDHILNADISKDVLDNVFLNYYAYVINKYFEDMIEEDKEEGVTLTKEQQQALLNMILSEEDCDE